MFSFLKKVLTHEPEEIVVTLEELSSIWMKHNKPFHAQRREEDAAAGTTGAPAEMPVNEAATPIQPVVPSPTVQVPVSLQPQPPTPPKGIDVQSSVFYKDLVEPYKQLFEQQKALPGVCEIIALLEKEGGCPSVVNTKGDSESDDIYSIADILGKVTLKKHSFLVAKIAIRLLQETYRDYEMMVPQTVVAALGHDLGKIPSLRGEGGYATEDHPNISARKVAEIFKGPDIHWINRVISAIKDHHRLSNDQFTAILKGADTKAREVEFAENSKDMILKEWSDWFNPQYLLDAIEPHVNVIQTDNKWKAFSFDGTVYCQTDIIYDEAKSLGNRHKIIDMSLLKATEKEVALKKIVNSLKGIDAINGVGEGYYGRHFEVQFGKIKRKMFLVPIKLDAFKNAPAIEKVKDSYPPVITAVAPSQK
jgi:hypothetical protein